MENTNNRQRCIIDPERFVAVWQQSESVEQVMSELGLNYHAALSRAHYFRKQGVPLQKFSSRPYRTYNWQALSEQARALRPETPKQFDYGLDPLNIPRGDQHG